MQNNIVLDTDVVGEQHVLSLTDSFGQETQDSPSTNHFKRKHTNTMDERTATNYQDLNQT